MDYSKIKVIQAQKNLSNTKFAESIGMSDNGYTKMLENATCTVETLEKICNVYKVPLTYFFDKKLAHVSEPGVQYGECKECLKKDERIKLLSEQLESKDKEIIKLNIELERAHPGEREEAGRNAGNF